MVVIVVVVGVVGVGGVGGVGGGVGIGVGAGVDGVGLAAADYFYRCGYFEEPASLKCFRSLEPHF